MGVSGNVSQLVELQPVMRDRIHVIRRFTGGGTVIVDSGTIFVTFICNKDDVPGLQPYPRPIMFWSSLLYNDVFRSVGNFKLRENDYVFGDRKFGGNAQSITKNRWIHHTSFLWDYEVNNMAYLKHPARAPEYRLARGHLEFICRMKDYMPRSLFIERTIETLHSHFSANSFPSDPIISLNNLQFTPSSRLLEMRELEEAAATAALASHQQNSAFDLSMSKVL